MLQDLFGKVKKRAAVEGKKKTSDMDVPQNLLFQCPKCRAVMLMDEFEENGKVCRKCGHHARLTAWERIRLTADPGSFRELDGSLMACDPIGFEDYPRKLENTRRATGLLDAVVTGTCSIQGSPCVIGVMDSRFMMASMGSAAGERITRAFETALEKGLPIVFFTASGGARMQEGMLSLMQMAKTAGAAKRHSDAGLLYVTVLTDPTTGGVTASFASLGDIILAEPGALIGFAGPRVIQQTIGQTLPEGFQRAEYQEEHGFVDQVVPRSKLRDTISQLLLLHQKGGRP